jgi:transcription antitermination factor NusG
MSDFTVPSAGAMSGSKRKWYALHVRSRHEKAVRAQLDAKQFSVFLPLYSHKHKWADRWKTVSLPLFPGYVFCHFELESRGSAIATSGVIDIVRVGNDPAPIPDSEIDSIQRVVNSPLLVEPGSNLVPGQQVMMCGGPLEGLSGALIENRKGLRLVIAVNLLHRSVLVEIDREWVVPLEPLRTTMRATSLNFDPSVQ